MDKFVSFQGVAAPLLQANIDTDAIIPSREMKRVSKEGLGEGLFAGWRYTLPGGREPRREFILNKPAYAGASIILGGQNFGCGSSREHAVWALKDFGVRVIIAPSFGSIFHTNCLRNGLLAIELTANCVQALADKVTEAPQAFQIEVDLARQSVQLGENRFEFDIDSHAKMALLQGLDAIGLTQLQSAAIDAFEQKRKAQRPWAFAPVERSVKAHD